MKDTAQLQGAQLGQQDAEARSSQRAIWAEGMWVVVLFADGPVLFGWPVQSFTAAEDTFFYHTSKFSMSFNLGSIYRQQS